MLKIRATSVLGGFSTRVPDVHQEAERIAFCIYMRPIVIFAILNVVGLIGMVVYTIKTSGRKIPRK